MISSNLPQNPFGAGTGGSHRNHLRRVPRGGQRARAPGHARAADRRYWQAIPPFHTFCGATTLSNSNGLAIGRDSIAAVTP